MTRAVTILFLCILFFTLTGCGQAEVPADTDPAVLASEETAEPSSVPESEPVQTAPTETEPPETETTAPPIVLELTEEEQTMLLKIGMAELGQGDCTECIALVMRTVLNRVEADRFGSSIRSVLFAPEQFTPVCDGSYYDAVPNERCYEALDMVMRGWDESQGALYYEFCEGESWHSKNLNLLFQHCDTRFYN